MPIQYQIYCLSTISEIREEKIYISNNVSLSRPKFWGTQETLTENDFA